MSAAGKAVTPSTETSITCTVRFGTSPPGGGSAGSAVPGALDGGAGGSARGIGEPSGTWRNWGGACASAGTVAQAAATSVAVPARRRSLDGGRRPTEHNRRPVGRASPQRSTIPPLL